MTIDAARDPVGHGRFRTHATNLDAVRELLAEVRITGRQIGQDQSAFGPLCGWILTGLGDRYARHEEQIAYVEETLLLMVEGLHRVADGKQELKALIRRDGDVMTIDGTPLIDEPSRSLRGLMDSVTARVQNRDWVEPQLAGAAPVAEFVAPVDQMYTALRVGGLHYAMTCIGPLRQLLDDLTGMPDVVASHATLWHTAGVDLQQLSVLLRQCLDQDLPRWDRLDVRSYRALMAHNVEALVGLAETSTAMAVITKAVGDLILLTRDIIRGIIGDLFARVILWTADTSTVISQAVMTTRLGTVVATTWRIHAYITALTTSITTLSRTVDG